VPATPPPSPPALFLVGPTASGKSALAARVAARAGMEVVSMDSMQVYRGIPVVSAQPEAELLAMAPHHLLEVADPTRDFDTATYVALCREVIASARARGRTCLFCGGTALYFRALVEGLSPVPSRSAPLRGELVDLERREGPGSLHRLLARIDPVAAARLHPNDTRRLVRALEIERLAGVPMTELFALPREPVVPGFVAVGIDVPRADLYRRIDERVDGMWRAGLVDEIRRLAARLPPGRLTIKQAIGYVQVTGHLEGRHSEAEALRLVKRDTRRFAARQIRQLRQDPRITWVPAPAAGAADPGALDEAAERVLSVHAAGADAAGHPRRQS
jgi:tRNA dimethylallyltransferase